MTKPAAAPKKVDGNALRKKISESVKGSAPSMVPSWEPPPAKEGEVVPQLEEAISDRKEVWILTDLVTRQVQLNQQKKALETQLDGINSVIKTSVSRYGITKVMVGDIKVDYYRTERKTISAIKLVACGVSPETVVACTDISVSATLKITAPKG